MLLNLVERTWRERLKMRNKEGRILEQNREEMESSGKIEKYFETNWKEVEKDPILLNRSW